MIAAAFVGYQLGASKGTFQEYVKSLGLVEPEHLQPDEKRAVADRARAIAERIAAMDKGR